MSDEAQNTLDAVKEEVKNAVSSRFNSPLLGPFIISWMAWNHRLIFALFSDGTLGERFSYIDEILYPTRSDFVFLNLLGPLASALFYICVLPWLSELVDELNLAWGRRRKAQLLRSEGLELLTARESRELRTENAEYRREGKKKDLKAAESRMVLAGWKAMALWNAKTGSANAAVDSFVRSQPFYINTHETPSVPIGRLTFGYGGTFTWETFYEAPYSDAKEWRLSGMELHLLDLSGRVIAQFAFDPGTCRFLGVNNALPYFLEATRFSQELSRDYP